MNKILTILFLLLAAGSLFAGGIENSSNRSAGYMRNPSKNTETKKPDAVFYNPAGTAFMKEGLYAELGNQFLYLNYTNDASDTGLNDEYSAVDPLLLYPNGEIVWRTGNFALFGGLSIVSGGGKVEYDYGTYFSSALLLSAGPPFSGEDHSFTAEATALEEIIGASYAFNNYISISSAVKFVQGKRKLNLTLDSDPGIGTTNIIDTAAEASGIGGILGIHINASEKIDISFQYHTKVKMEYEYTNVDGFAAILTALLIEEGNKYRQDIPAVLSGGIGYQLLDDLYTSLSFGYYFNKGSSFESGLSLESEYDNSWETGAGAEFAFNDMIVLSGGVLYSKQGYKDDQNSAEGPILDSITIGSGAGLMFIEDLTIDIGLSKPFYFDADYETAIGDLKLSRKLFLISIGATYKIF